MVGESSVTLEIATPRFENWLCHLLAVCFGQVNSSWRVSVYSSVKVGITVLYLPPRAIRVLNGALFANTEYATALQGGVEYILISFLLYWSRNYCL